MNVILISFLYLIESTLQLVLMKIITDIYDIDNIIFNSIFRSLMFPYYIYKLIQYYRKNENKLIANWYDIGTGILDQLDIILSYIGFAGLTIGEYITYRTFSIFLGTLYLLMYYKKMLSLQKISSILLIFCSSIILLTYNFKSNFLFSFVCLSSSVASSLINFIIEINVVNEEGQKLNFYWTKTMSYIIAFFITIVTQFNYGTLTKIFEDLGLKDIIIIMFLELCISILENFYYYLKINLIISNSKNGSIIAQFVDIIRRFMLIVIGTIFFGESYSFIIYLCIVIMFFGSLIGLFNKELIVYFYYKYINRNTFEKQEDLQDVELTNV